MSGDIQLEIRGQTPQEAFDYLERTLGDMEFFRANGYDVALPNHPAFDGGTETLGSLEQFEREVYRAEAFDAALAALKSDRTILKGAVDWFADTPEIDGFRRFDRYQVVLTLYGPGGSYDPATGTITLFTTEDGRFKGGGGAHTIVHEMMHLAVEQGIVQRFDLSHWEKERLVDLLAQREFSELFPDYRLQDQGVDALNAYVEDVPLHELAASLQRYRNETGSP